MTVVCKRKEQDISDLTGQMPMGAALTQMTARHDPSPRRVVLFPRRFCETRAGNLAHAVGRIVFKPGQPMLVEHLGGLYLEHDLTGRVMTPGYGDDYHITHVYADSCM